MKKYAVVILALALAGACKKQDSAAPASGSAEPSAPAAPAPAPAPASAPAAPTGGASADDCAAYAAVLEKCAKGAADTKNIEASCRAVLAANNAMTASMKVQVGCAKTNAECDAYTKCVATTR